MLSVKHATLHNASHNAPWRSITASFLTLLSLLLMLPPTPLRGDDLTGLPQDDPKDLLTFSAARPQASGVTSFLAMPSWSRVVTMSPLPDQLKPLGKKITVAASPAPAPPALPKEAPPAAPAPTATASKEKTSPAPAETSPTLIAVSPFLEWIKANPQAAAAEARQQANSYHAPSTSAPGSSSGTASTGGAGSAGSGPSGNMEDPYWLPPLLDSADSDPRSVAGSAAIYQTPQR